MMESTIIQQNLHKIPADPKPIAFPWDMFQSDLIHPCPSNKKLHTFLFQNSIPHVGMEFLLPIPQRWKMYQKREQPPASREAEFDPCILHIWLPDGDSFRCL
jgi:hypothetical protein